MSDDRRQLVGALAVLAAAACFATLGPVSRFAYDAGMEPLGFVTWRAAIGAIAMGAFVVWRVRRGGPWVSLVSLPRRAQAALATATLMGVLLNLAIFMAFERITIALALLGLYTYPAMVAIVGSLVHREPIGLSKVIALGLALGGMTLVVAGQLDPGAGLRLDLIGLLLALSAAACQTVFVTVSRRGYSAVPTDQAMTVILAGATFGNLAIAGVMGSVGAITFPLGDGSVWGLLLVAGLLGAGLPSFFFLTGIRWIGGLRTGILALFEPVVAVVLAALLLGEGLRPIQIMGGLLVLSGAVAAQRSPRRETEETFADRPIAAIVAD
jgi:drug/metabolite transporter (DMT)-like permease